MRTVHLLLGYRSSNRSNEPHSRWPSLVLHQPYLRAALALASMTLLMTADAMVRNRGDFEYWMMNTIQDIDAPYLQQVMVFVSNLTMASLGIAIWAVVLTGFAVTRRWLPALATLVIPLGIGINKVLREVIVNRPRPDESRLHRIIGENQLESFPSGHVVGAVLLYGLLFYVARKFTSPPLRLATQTFSVFVIVTVGISRVWLGTHWIGDVVAGYTLGGLFLVGVLWAYQRIDASCGTIPFVHSAYVPHDESRPHAHALTSTILFNGDTVSKIYAPGFVPRAIYWLAFQAEFPYMRNQSALRAAVLRRNLAGKLTEYWYGENRVACAIGIDEIDGRYAITSELIAGSEPRDRHLARAFLFDLDRKFEQAGLPTWQVDPRQPRGIDNLIETPDGRFHIIDLESGLVSPMASPRAWSRAFRRGLVPLYDDVFFDITREYVAGESAAMAAQMGADWIEELVSLIDRADIETQRWHDSEPRIWSRIIRFLQSPRGRHGGKSGQDTPNADRMPDSSPAVHEQTVFAQSRVVILGLVCIAGVLVAVDIIVQSVQAMFHPGFPGGSDIRIVTELEREGSFGTWFSVIALALLAILLGIVGFVNLRERARGAWYWLGLAALATAFSIVEQVRFHRTGSGALQERYGLDGPFHDSWVVMGVISVGVVALAYRRFLARLPDTTRRLFLLAAGLYVTGELLLEMAAGWYVDATGTADLIYQTITTFEEALGMTGVVVAIGGTLHYIGEALGGIRIIIGSPAVDALIDSPTPSHKTTRSGWPIDRMHASDRRRERRAIHGSPRPVQRTRNAPGRRTA